MEIHHHPKHSSKPREIKEYIFEFLIIFVAITGSFFAENLRERYVDKYTVKEYMKSLLQDLKADTLDLGKELVLNQNVIKGLDSLRKTMEKPLVGDNLKQFYQYNSQYTVNYHPFMPTNRTISQLMNTGALRLIKDKTVSDSIVIYDQLKIASQLQSEFIGNQITKIIDEEAEIINFLTLMKSSSSSLHQQDLPALLTSDEKAISSYYFKIMIFFGTTQSYTLGLEEVKKQATSLIHLIEKEYKLK